MKHIVFFSGGAGSYGAARRVVDQFGAENTILFFTDTMMEDEDLYRFIHEAAASLGAELKIIADGRDPWQVFFDVKFLGNSMIDPCSRILKRQLSRKWIEDNFKPDECILYLGIDWTEEHRFVRSKRFWEPYRVEAPLCEAPFILKTNILQDLVERGIDPPRLYESGFGHNNCFSGTTEVLTDQGIKTLEELNGSRASQINNKVTLTSNLCG